MKKIIAFLLVVSLSAACQSKKSALNYSEAIVAMENSITPTIQIAEKSVEGFYNAQKYDSIAAVGERMEKLLQQKVDEIEAMKAPDVKEIGNFKAACIKAFKATKNVYTSYKNFGRGTTEEERKKLFGDVEKAATDKNLAVTDMQNAQRRFAAENGFKIQ